MGLRRIQKRLRLDARLHRAVETRFSQLVARYHVGSLLDAPCGDFNWMQHVEFPDAFQYIGGDIVQDLVDELSRNYESGGRRFVRLDVTRDELPSADLWLCRDCLFHLPNADILAALKNFQRSDIKYLLTTTFTFPRSNMDIEHGEFRYLNLELAPFSLPKPLAYSKITSCHLPRDGSGCGRARNSNTGSLRRLGPLLLEAGVALALAGHLDPAGEQPRVASSSRSLRCVRVVPVFLEGRDVIFWLCGSSWKRQAASATVSWYGLRSAPDFR